MRHVADTEGDKVEAQIRLGVTVNGYRLERPGRGSARGAGRARSRTCSAAYEADYEVAPELRRDGARREELREAARIEVGAADVPDRRRVRGIH